jgi:hypothetical protein
MANKAAPRQAANLANEHMRISDGARRLRHRPRRRRPDKNQNRQQVLVVLINRLAELVMWAAESDERTRLTIRLLLVIALTVFVALAAFYLTSKGVLAMLPRRT